jgi:hypothetical protein
MAARLPPQRRARSASTPPRDMDASSFQQILSDLVERIPGAYGASLVDSEGESVDYAGQVTPFDVRLAGAHWRIVIDDISRTFLGRPGWLAIRGSSKSFLTCTLPDEYALVVLLKRRAGFGSASRALSACVRALHAEARWPLAAPSRHWSPVKVTCDSRRRPCRISAAEGTSYAVEVIGSVVGLAKRDRGFRVRLDSGKEVTLVREPRDYWYADEAIDEK